MARRRSQEHAKHADKPRTQLLVTVTRLAAAMLEVLHDWLHGTGPGRPRL